MLTLCRTAVAVVMLFSVTDSRGVETEACTREMCAREAAKFKVSKECAKATFCVRMILKDAKKIMLEKDKIGAVQSATNITGSPVSNEEIQSLSTQLNKAKEEYSALARDYQELNASYVDLQQLSDNQQLTNQLLSQQLAEQAEQNRGLREDLTKLAVDNKKQSSKIDALRAELANVQQENINILRNLELAQAQHEAARAQNSTALSECEKIRIQNRLLVEENKILWDKIDSLLNKDGPARAAPLSFDQQTRQNSALSPGEQTLSPRQPALSGLRQGGESHLFLLTEELDNLVTERRQNIQTNIDEEDSSQDGEFYDVTDSALDEQQK